MYFALKLFSLSYLIVYYCSTLLFAFEFLSVNLLNLLKDHDMILKV